MLHIRSRASKEKAFVRRGRRTALKMKGYYLQYVNLPVYQPTRMVRKMGRSLLFYKG